MLIIFILVGELLLFIPSNYSWQPLRRTLVKTVFTLSAFTLAFTRIYSSNTSLLHGCVETEKIRNFLLKMQNFFRWAARLNAGKELYSVVTSGNRNNCMICRPKGRSKHNHINVTDTENAMCNG